ncbi:MAG: hypothetical protein JST16_06775 [Bdellovibrionales bacterium]|nr:hypothetical protein [Bdellovibrionales bacterium]
MNHSLITNLSLVVALGASQASLAQSSVAQDRQQAAIDAVKNSGKGPLEMGMDWLTGMLNGATATMKKHANLGAQWQKWDKDYGDAGNKLDSVYRDLGGEQMADEYQRAIEKGVKIAPDMKRVADSVASARKTYSDVQGQLIPLRMKTVEAFTAKVQADAVKSALAATQGSINEVNKAKANAALARYDAALKSLDESLLKSPMKTLADVHGSFLDQKIDDLRVKKERMERLYDRTIMGNYLQTKMEDLLASRQFCLAAQTCVQTGKPQKVVPLNSLFVHPEEKSDAPAEKKSH